MRVLYFSDSYGPHDYRFLEALDRSGWDVLFLQRRPGSTFESRPLPKGVRHLGFLEATPRRRRLGYALADRLPARLAELEVDVVHAGPVQDCAWLAARAGFPCLVTMSWGSDLLDRANFGLGRWLARAALRRSAAFLGDCEAVRQRAIGLGMDPERTVTFPWGVDLERFRPGADSAARSALGWDTAFVALCVRSWEPRYGIDTVLEGFTLAARRDPSLRLILAGDGSLRSWVIAEVEASGLAERIWLPGFVPYGDLPMLYHAADVYLSASHSDGSSVSLLEAMACGLPALVSDIPGNREWVEPGVSGLWFPRGDAVRLSQLLLEASSVRGDLRRFGARGREIVEDRADWRQNSPMLLDAYAIALDPAEGDR